MGTRPGSTLGPLVCFAIIQWPRLRRFRIVTHLPDISIFEKFILWHSFVIITSCFHITLLHCQILEIQIGILSLTLLATFVDISLHFKLFMFYSCYFSLLLSLKSYKSYFLDFFAILRPKWHSFILTFFRFMNGSESFSVYLRIQSGVVNWRFLDEYLMFWFLFEEGCIFLHVKPKNWLNSFYGKSKYLLLYINTVNWINNIFIEF